MLGHIVGCSPSMEEKGKGRETEGERDRKNVGVVLDMEARSKLFWPHSLPTIYRYSQHILHVTNHSLLTRLLPLRWRGCTNVNSTHKPYIVHHIYLFIFIIDRLRTHRKPLLCETAQAVEDWQQTFNTNHDFTTQRMWIGTLPLPTHFLESSSSR